MSAADQPSDAIKSQLEQAQAHLEDPVEQPPELRGSDTDKTERAPDTFLSPFKRLAIYLADFLFQLDNLKTLEDHLDFESLRRTLDYSEGQIQFLKKRIEIAAKSGNSDDTSDSKIRYGENMASNPSVLAESVLQDVAALKADMTNVKTSNAELKTQLSELLKKIDDLTKTFSEKFDALTKELQTANLAVKEVQTRLSIYIVIVGAIATFVGPILVDLVKRPAAAAITQPPAIAPAPASGLSPAEIEAFREWMRNQGRNQSIPPR